MPFFPGRAAGQVVADARFGQNIVAEHGLLLVIEFGPVRSSPIQFGQLLRLIGPRAHADCNLSELGVKELAIAFGAVVSPAGLRRSAAAARFRWPSCADSKTGIPKGEELLKNTSSRVALQSFFQVLVVDVGHLGHKQKRAWPSRCRRRRNVP